MASSVGTLLIVFGIFFAGSIALIIGYFATPNPILLGLCYIVGFITLVTGFILFHHWLHHNA